MKILVVSQYFWPENFRVNDVALGLKERGHEVTVLTGKPNYPSGKFYEGYSFFGQTKEVWKGIQILRAPLSPRGSFGLAVNYLSFAFLASLKALFIKKEYDVILVYGMSPITMGIPAIVVSVLAKIPIFYWVHDLWPESITAAGGTQNRFVIGIMDWVTRFIYKMSYKVLVQSRGFIPYILNQQVPAGKLVYYPNYAENFYRILDKDTEYSKLMPEGFKLMFAGNIGEAQGFYTLLKAALILKEKAPEVKWVILGDGSMKQTVEKKIKEMGLEKHFVMLGSFPPTEMSRFFSCADALVVSLKKNPIFALTIPSKVQPYLACGKPIIASIDGEGASVIQEAQAGFTSASDDEHGLAEAVLSLYKLDESARLEMGKNAKAFYEKEFDRELLISKLEGILAG